MAQHSDQGDHGDAGGHAGHDAHTTHHPTARTYIIVGAFLTLITVVEVWA